MAQATYKEKYKELNDRDWLQARYHEDKMTLREIADMVGCSFNTVLRAFREHAVTIRSPKESLDLRGTGPEERFPELRNTDWLKQKYIIEHKSTFEIATILGCSAALVLKALKKTEIERRPRSLKGRRYTRRALGSKIRRSDGYVYMLIPEHPRGRRGWIREHIVMAEAELGRYLKPGEEVHHLNENRSDNRPENLMVFPTHGRHTAFHENPPAWVPRCKACERPRPQILEGRPEGVPMLWTPESATAKTATV